MDNILNIMSHYTKKYNPLKVSRIFDKAYNYFKEYNHVNLDINQDIET